MARIIGSYEAKTRFAELIRDASAGEEIIITNHGKPVARIVPPDDLRVTPAAEIISSIFRLRQSVGARKVSAEEVKDAIESGRA